ncbi:MAG: molybdopterin molybdotransferase MoeA [Actinomycetota bacterium]|nr:molybdopterin molybdotransferase MoeA [Actinomycetota bacterium]
MEVLVPVPEARARVLAGIGPLPAVRVAVADAVGSVVAAPVVALAPVPPFANSAMDGYALRAADTASPPVRLRVLGTVMAGSPRDAPIGPGEAVRIMTGAPIPDGADAVCMFERTEVSADGTCVTVSQRMSPGDHVRRAGGDVEAGAEVFAAGAVLSPGALGVLAGLGLAEVLVHRLPVVGVLSTGDELVEAPAPLGPGQIHESNRTALLALLRRSGFPTVDLGVVSDDEATVAGALGSAARRCDVLLTSGGVSVGDRDVVKAVLGEISRGSMQWMQVAVRPAKPFAFGRIGDSSTPVFGLPGNPVSALVSFELFARPALCLMAGRRELDRPVALAVADEALERRRDGKLHLVRVQARLEGDGLVHVRSSGGQESNQLHAMARANALALLPDGDGIATGGRVEVMLLDGDAIGPGSPALALRHPA